THVVDGSEARNYVPVWIPGQRLLRVGRSRVRQLSPVEHIIEFNPYIQGDTLGESERPADCEVLHGTAGVAVVAVIRGGGAELPRGRIDPSGRIQNEIQPAIDAMAVRILDK